MRNVNWQIAALGALWWWQETNYFGWNAQPKSIAELFADGLALAFFAAALAFPRRTSGVVVAVEKSEPSR